jgi:hypothetical protein
VVIDTDCRRGRDRMVIGYFGDRCKCQKLVSISYCHRRQSVSITTEIVNSNPVDGEVYSIQHYVTKFVT